MKPKLIISDWNGTLITDVDDKPVLKQIAMDELKYAAMHLKLDRVIQLASTKKQLDAMVEQYKDDPQSQAELLRATYDLYNREVIDGMPLWRIELSVERYANRAVKRLDGAFHETMNAGIRIGNMPKILTSAYDKGVKSVCNKLGYYLIVSGSKLDLMSISTEGCPAIARGIQLRNYEDKGSALLDFRSRLDGSNIAYIGDDFRDEPCVEFACVFVVAPLATDEYRQHMASEYGSKVRTPGRAKGEVYKALITD